LRRGPDISGEFESTASRRVNTAPIWQRGARCCRAKSKDMDNNYQRFVFCSRALCRCCAAPRTVHSRPSVRAEGPSKIDTGLTNHNAVPAVFLQSGGDDAQEYHGAGALQNGRPRRTLMRSRPEPNPRAGSVIRLPSLTR
jgi:hypothetical protein